MMSIEVTLPSRPPAALNVKVGMRFRLDQGWLDFDTRFEIEGAAFWFEEGVNGDLIRLGSETMPVANDDESRVEDLEYLNFDDIKTDPKFVQFFQQRGVRRPRWALEEIVRWIAEVFGAQWKQAHALVERVEFKMIESAR